MEEKKKRFRPTLTAYRALEKELAEVRENYRVQSLFCKYSDEEIAHLKDAADEVVVWKNRAQEAESKCKMLKGLRDDFENKWLTSEQSNRLLEDEVRNLRMTNARQKKGLDEANAEVDRLYRRGFWKRLFNL